MSQIQYKCPHCGNWSRKKCVYYAGNPKHKCSSCGKMNQLAIGERYETVVYLKGVQKAEE